MPNYPVTPATIPSGFCPSTWQEILNEFSNLQTVTIPASNSQLVVSPTKPADTTVGWYQLDSTGRPIRIYVFAQGAWLSLHPTAPGLTDWWFDTLPDFTVFDGGDSNPISAISGPMWQQAKRADGTVIAAQFPIAAGTLPSLKVLNVGDTGGEEAHSLTIAEMPPHTHTKNLFLGDYPRSTDDRITLEYQEPDVPEQAGQDPANFVTDSTGGAGTPPVVTPHNTLPPYVVGYLLQRTQRLWYAVS